MNMLAPLLWVFAAAVSADPAEKQAEEAFRGWSLVGKAAGDLNGDQVADLAVTLQKPAPGEAASGEYKGLLVVFLGGPDGKLRLHTKAPKAVCVGCGGPKAAFDTVLGEISITPKGVLVVTYEGGSREAWTATYKWRHDAETDRFLLIGETHDTRDTLSDDGEMESGEVSSEDVNYLSGKMLRTISKHGTQACKVKPRRRPVELRSFDFESEQAREDEKFVKGSCKRS